MVRDERSGWGKVPGGIFITQARGHADISADILHVLSKSDRFMFIDAVFSIEYVYIPITRSDFHYIATSTATVVVK